MLKFVDEFIQHYFSFEKGSGMQSDPKFGHRGVMLEIPMPGKKCSGMPFKLVSF
jgi:hypothetical protein